MRFFGRSNPAVLEDENLGPPLSKERSYTVGIPFEDLTWDLSLPGLTTQYKSFYFNFDNGSAGYIQYAYGNLGVLVKVAPLGYSYYPVGQEAIVASHTLRASQMQVSQDHKSVTVAQHSLTMDTDNHGWNAVINDDKLKYDLHFRITGEAFEVRQFGRETSRDYIRQRCIPSLIVTGSVTANGKKTSVKGIGTYSEAYYTNIKFTDFCNEFTNFRFVSEDSSQVLQLMQYIPRTGTSKGPLISHGSFTRNGKVEAICSQNKSLATGKTRHEDSGYDLPTDLSIDWAGETIDGKPFHATCVFATKQPSSVTDVLGMFPKFFKDIVAIFAGLPYVFCWQVPETTASIEIDGVKHEMHGTSTTELTKVHKPAS